MTSSEEYYFRNESFILLFLLFLFPTLGFQRTINFSLDEMYYVLILFPILLLALNRNLFYLAGLLFTFIILSRVSYIFLSAGLYFGWLLNKGWETKSQLKIITGFLIGFVFVLSPFLLVSGSSIFQQNFVINSLINSEGIKNNNYFFTIIRDVSSLIHFPIGLILIGLITILFIYLFSFVISKYPLTNPFGNVSFAALLAFTIPFTPLYEDDYILSLIIPLFFCIAFSNKPQKNIF